MFLLLWQSINSTQIVMLKLHISRNSVKKCRCLFPLLKFSQRVAKAVWTLQKKYVQLSTKVKQISSHFMMKSFQLKKMFLLPAYTEIQG